MTYLKEYLIRQKEEELEDLRAQARADNRREAFNVLRRVERVARYKGGLAEAIDYLNDDDAELLAEFCATVLRITARSERVLPDGVTINPEGNCGFLPPRGDGEGNTFSEVHPVDSISRDH